MVFCSSVSQVQLQERYARKVEELRKVPETDSETCADCRLQRSTWTNVTYGVFICMSCAGVHRKLATSRVMSLTLDDWSKDEYEKMSHAGGNRAVNLALNPGNEPCPNAADHGRLETFIREKYELRKLQRRYYRMHQRRDRQAANTGGSSTASSSQARASARQMTAPDSASVGLQPTWKASLQRDVPVRGEKQPASEPFFSVQSQEAAQAQTQAQALAPAPQMLPAQPQVQYQMLSNYSQQPIMSAPAYQQAQPQIQYMPTMQMPQQQPQPQMYLQQQPTTFVAPMNMQPSASTMFMSQPQFASQPQMTMQYMQQQPPQQQQMASYPAFQQPQQFYVYQ